ncbi:MAG: phage virion morphogenesis protein [Treponematales bacterium]
MEVFQKGTGVLTAGTDGAVVSFDLKEIDAVKNMLAKAALTSEKREELLGGIGVEMETQTQERFDTQKSPDGDSWKALAEKTRAYYLSKDWGGRSLLAGEGMLKDSVMSEVRDPWSVLVGATMEYAAVHQFGAEIKPKKAKALFVPGYGRLQKVNIPARPYLGVSGEDAKEIEIAVANYLAGNFK